MKSPSAKGEYNYLSLQASNGCLSEAGVAISYKIEIASLSATDR